MKGRVMSWRSKQKKLLQLLQVVAAEATPTTPTVVHTTSSRLKPKLPTFTGEMLAWKDFWSLFSSVIDAEKSLTNSEKVCLLVEAMGDRESRRLAHEASAN